MPGSATIEVCKRFVASMKQCSCTKNSKLAVALSGGPDSTALALLCAWWAGTATPSRDVEAIFQTYEKEPPGLDETVVPVSLVIHQLLSAEAADQNVSSPAKPLTRHTTEGRPQEDQAHCRPYALIVDHNLRAGSNEECKLAQETALGLGLVPQVTRMEWPSGSPSPGDLLAAARQARYHFLVSTCRGFGIDCLLTAHHADDQVETFLMRLSRASGVVGLAAMPVARIIKSGLWSDDSKEADGLEAGKLVHIRPLLGCDKSQLEEVCRENNLGFVTDPTNTDCRFLRARLRGLLHHQALFQLPSLPEQARDPPDGASVPVQASLRGRPAPPSARAWAHSQPATPEGCVTGAHWYPPGSQAAGQQSVEGPGEQASAGDLASGTGEGPGPQGLQPGGHGMGDSGLGGPYAAHAEGVQLRDDVLRLVAACREARVFLEGEATEVLRQAIIPPHAASSPGIGTLHAKRSTTNKLSVKSPDPEGGLRAEKSDPAGKMSENGAVGGAILDPLSTIALLPGPVLGRLEVIGEHEKDGLREDALSGLDERLHGKKEWLPSSNSLHALLQDMNRPAGLHMHVEPFRAAKKEAALLALEAVLQVTTGLPRANPCADVR
eukprot:jgi/Botrbrau1/10295/Bobra.0120s0013.4